MKIYLIDINTHIIDAWNRWFGKECDVTVVHDDFNHFLDSNIIECIVSPANSFGIMDGGYDKEITRRYGDQLMKRVQKHIIDNYYGEQPVGTSFLIDTGCALEPYLIHTPSMRYTQRIIDTQVIYHCMRSCLITALNNDIESILIPAFGGATGKVEPPVIADMMYKAYKQFEDVPKDINWDYVRRRRI